MSFHKQIEQQLAQEFSPKAQPIVINYQDAVFHGRRLHDQEMHRLLGLAWHALAAGLKRMVNASQLRNIDKLPNHLRQDIGLGPISGSASRGYM